MTWHIRKDTSIEREVQLTGGKIDELLLICEGEHAADDEVLLLIPSLRPLGPLGSIKAEPLAGDLPVAPEELSILLPLLGIGVVEQALVNLKVGLNKVRGVKVACMRASIRGRMVGVNGSVCQGWAVV